MRVAAPGKLLLTGAYAVLEGSPAIVVAVDRLATADTEKRAFTSTREVELAFGRDAPHVDAGSLYESGLKLGLGSSAATLVAALATRRARYGADLSSDLVRRDLFLEARTVHAASQGGGSGADVAASVYGGALCYSLTSVAPVQLPPGLHLAAFFSGKSARTSDLRAAVEALRVRDPDGHRDCLGALHSGAALAVRAVATGALELFLTAAEITRIGLRKLAVRADAPIVPEAFATLGTHAEREGAVFLPSGAGGGDVGVFLGRAAPSLRFADRATSLGFTHVPLAVDEAGVRVLPSETNGAS